MAAVAFDEVSQLLKEYSTLKRLVDSHKRQRLFRTEKHHPYPSYQTHNFNRYSRKTDPRNYTLTRSSSKPLPPISTSTKLIISNKTTLRNSTIKDSGIQTTKPAPPLSFSSASTANKSDYLSSLQQSNASGIQQSRPKAKLPQLTATPAAGFRKKLFKYKIVNPNENKISPINLTSKPVVERSSKYSWTANTQISYRPKRRMSSSDSVGFIKSKYRLMKLKSSPKSMNGSFRKGNKSANKLKNLRFKNSPNSSRVLKSFAWGSNKTRFVYSHSAVNSYKLAKTKFERNAVKRWKQGNLPNDPAALCNITKFSRHKMISVDGVKFMVNGNRRRLHKGVQTARKSLDSLRGSKAVQANPNSNLKKSDHIRYIANRAVNLSIFRLNVAKQKTKKYCLFYNKFGKCTKKENGTCPYIHDPDKVAVCKRFLRGSCDVENCPFAHTHSRDKMPACSFFLHGTCHNGESCNYSHVNVNRDAEICSDFVDGYCASGMMCKKWHLNRCNRFEKKGHCDRDKCRLLHRKRAVDQLANPPDYVPQPSISISPDSTNTNCCEKIKWAQEPLPAFIPINDCDKDEPSDYVTGVNSNSTLQIRPKFLMTETRKLPLILAYRIYFNKY